MHVPATTQRVPMHTAERVNERIRLLTRQRIDYYFDHRDEIPKRLRELDEEWDIERILEVNASTLALSSLILGLTINKNLLLLSGLVLGFLCQHSIQGWCPPVPVFRRMGVRTRYEIEQERFALKVLRGDFAEIGQGSETDTDRLLAAVRS